MELQPSDLKLHYYDRSGSDTHACFACAEKPPIGNTREVSVGGKDTGWVCAYHYTILEALVSRNGPARGLQLFLEKHPRLPDRLLTQGDPVKDVTSAVMEAVAANHE